MIKRSLVATFLMLSSPVIGATIEWDALTFVDSRCYVEANLGKGRSLSLGLEKESLGQGRYSYSASFFNLMFVGNWCQASYGDVVCADAFSNDASDIAYFSVSGEDIYVNAGSSAIAYRDEIMYLVFRCGSMDEDLKFQDIVYGWVEYSVGRDGTLTYQHSAWDLDGGAMIVGGGSYGPIPEPSGGLLVLIGFAALALRRNKRCSR